MRTTPWTKIKAEYLQGVTPKELAEKYKLAAKTISEKACKENWTEEKAIICKNLQAQTQAKIQKLTNLALDTLQDVIDDEETERGIKVSAAKAILDISGLKSSKQELTGGLDLNEIKITRKIVKVNKPDA